MNDKQQKLNQLKTLLIDKNKKVLFFILGLIVFLLISFAIYFIVVPANRYDDVGQDIVVPLTQTNVNQLFGSDADFSATNNIGLPVFTFHYSDSDNNPTPQQKEDIFKQSAQGRISAINNLNNSFLSALTPNTNPTMLINLPQLPADLLKSSPDQQVSILERLPSSEFRRSISRVIYSEYNIQLGHLIDENENVSFNGTLNIKGTFISTSETSFPFSFYIEFYCNTDGEIIGFEGYKIEVAGEVITPLTTPLQ